MSKHPRSLLALALTLVVGSPLAAGPALAAADSITVWRGFHHFWEDKNHRIDRLGDFVTIDSCISTGCDADTNHTAATGTADDVAHFTSRFTHINTESAAFQPGNRTITLSGSEGGDIDVTTTVSVSAPLDMRSKNKYTVVINGFDLRVTDGNPDKVESFEIDLSSVTYDSAARTMNFTLQTAINMDCDSIECSTDNVAEYEMKVWFVLVAGNNGQFRFSSDSVGNSYTWDTTDEIFHSDETETNEVVGTGGSAYGDAALGFQRIQFDLDNDGVDWWNAAWDLGCSGLHLFALATQLTDLDYEASSGTMTYDLDLFFKSWQEGMSVGAYKTNGSATFNADVILLQFADAFVDHDFVTGEFDQDSDHVESTAIDFDAP